LRFSPIRKNRKQELAPTKDDASTISIEFSFFSVLNTGASQCSFHWHASGLFNPTAYHVAAPAIRKAHESIAAGRFNDSLEFPKKSPERAMTKLTRLFLMRPFHAGTGCIDGFRSEDRASRHLPTLFERNRKNVQTE